MIGTDIRSTEDSLIGLFVIPASPLIWLAIHVLIAGIRDGYITIRGYGVYRNKRREEFWLWYSMCLLLTLLISLFTLFLGYLSWEDGSSAFGFSLIFLIAIAIGLRRPKEKHPKIDRVLSAVVVGLAIIPIVRNAYMFFVADKSRWSALVVIGVGSIAAAIHALILTKGKPLLRFIKPKQVQKRR